MKSRYNPVLFAAIIVGLCAALWLNWTRHTIEQRNDTVEMAMEYENLRQLAALQGLPEDDVLNRFKAAGINSLMIFDTTLERLTKKGAIITVTGAELQKSFALGGSGGVFSSLRDGQVLANAVYIAENGDKETFDNVITDLRLRYGAERVAVVNTTPRIFAVLGSTELVPEDKFDVPLGLMQAPLGLPVADMRKLSAMGFNIIVRPQNYVHVTPAQIDSIFHRIKVSGANVTAYMPCGTETVGYPDMLWYLGGRMKENNMQLVMLEHYTQLRFAQIAGLVPLAAEVEYNAARSYVIDGLEQKKISVGEALRRWALTDEERNIRVNYIRPFLMPKDGKDLMTLNLEYVKNIADSVKERGYKIGTAGVFSREDVGDRKFGGPYFPDKIWFIPVLAAIVAGCVMYLALLLDLSRRKQLFIWFAVTLFATLLVMLGRGLLTRQALALGAAAVFPVLSMSYIINIWESYRGEAKSLWNILKCALWQLALAIALSLVGAALLSAILTDSRFLLEIDIYRGVKLTFMLPVLLIAAVYIKKYNLFGLMGRGVSAAAERAVNLLDTRITFKHLVLAGIALFIVYYFVGRSGHTGGVPVPAIEIKMRTLLEQLMYARPREKEFLIGHPAFFLAAFAAYRNAPRLWQFILVLGAVIGQGSLVQTFCHMRTPVIMSFVRALDGYAVGSVLGIITVCAAAFLLPYIIRWKRRFLEQ